MGTVQAIAAAISNFFSALAKGLGMAQSAQERKTGADDLAAEQNADVAQRMNQGEQDAAKTRDLGDADRHFSVQHNDNH